MEGSSTNLPDSPGNDTQLPSLLSLKVDPPEDLSEENPPAEVVLPQALEEVLALKTQRALELGTEIDAEHHQTDVEKEAVVDKEENVVVCGIMPY